MQILKASLLTYIEIVSDTAATLSRGVLLFECLLLSLKTFPVR